MFTKYTKQQFKLCIEPNSYVSGQKITTSDLENIISENCVKDELSNRWTCAFCGQFGGRLDISRHIEAKHVTLPNLKCDLCGKLSKTRDSLQRHMNKYHK